MTLKRHSPFAIGIGIFVLALAPGVFLANAAHTDDLDDSQGQALYRQCMVREVNAYETERLDAYRQYHAALEDAYQQRWQDVQQAWQITDSRDRRDALRDIDRSFRTFERDLSREHKMRLRDAGRVYKDASRDCDDQYRQWKRDALDARRAAPAAPVDYSTYPPFGGSTYGGQYDSYRQTGTYGQTSTYYDQTSYYDDLLERTRKQQQQESYRYTQTAPAVTRTYGAPQNIRCGDGICQAGELNVCSYDCVAYPERSDDTWTSRYVYGQGWIEPVQY